MPLRLHIPLPGPLTYTHTFRGRRAGGGTSSAATLAYWLLIGWWWLTLKYTVLLLWWTAKYSAVAVIVAFQTVSRGLGRRAPTGPDGGRGPWRA